MSKVLIADDEHAICQAFSRLLKMEGHTPLVASNGKQAVSFVRSECPDAVFMDVRMPGMNGLEALKVIHEEKPELPVVVMTAFGSVQTAMDAMQSGAFDYLGKPIELKRVRAVLQRALHRPQTSGNGPPSAVPVSDADVRVQERSLIGQSAPMQEIFKLMGLLTTNDLTVLITGESGSGKELVARGIHDHGTRQGAPFIAVNCAAIPEQLLESELFGHEKGAFTGAAERRIGRIEAAAGGTLFLDEIGDLPQALQSKLLRLLQERSFERVGSHQPLPLEARVIAATNQMLEHEVEKGRFREDLYHRIDLVNLRLPPLRKRREDIPLLARHFLSQANRELGKGFLDFEPAALKRLRQYDWPGNVRELEHVIKRSALQGRGQVLAVHDLDLADSSPEQNVGLERQTEPDSPMLDRAVRGMLDAAVAEPDEDPYHTIVDRVERILIEEALRRTGGNQVTAARLLGINRATLRKKMPSSNLPDQNIAT